MNTYVIRRRNVAETANGLDAALTRMHLFEEQSALPTHWLKSYVVREPDDNFGLACMFSTDDEHTLRDHAQATRLPADEIVRVTFVHDERVFAPTLVHLVRRRRAWSNEAEARRAGRLAARIAAEPELKRHLVWLCSHTVIEDDGSLGSFCLYQTVDARLLVEHARRAGMPATEIVPVLGRIVFRDDPPERPTASLSHAAP
jgi:hypothetical protein